MTKMEIHKAAPPLMDTHPHGKTVTSGHPHTLHERAAPHSCQDTEPAS